MGTMDDVLKAKVQVKTEQVKKPEDKKPVEKKPEEKKPEEKKPAEKKPEEKKPEEKKPEEKKPEETSTVTLTTVEIHNEIVKLVNDNLTPGSTSKFDVRYINPNDKKILDVNISPRNFKRKTAEEVDELISEQVIKQMVSFGLNITKDDIKQAKLEPKKPAEKKPAEKKPEEKKPEEKRPAEKKKK